MSNQLLNENTHIINNFFFSLYPHFPFLVLLFNYLEWGSTYQTPDIRKHPETRPLCLDFEWRRRWRCSDDCYKLWTLISLDNHLNTGQFCGHLSLVKFDGCIIRLSGRFGPFAYQISLGFRCLLYSISYSVLIFVS